MPKRRHKYRYPIVLAGLLLSITETFAVAPPSTYVTIKDKVTPHGVQYWAGHPKDYSTAKKYFLCINHSGAGPASHRLLATFEFYGYGESVGFNPIYLGIDYGTDTAPPAAGDPLWSRYYEAITDIRATYPNLYPGVFMTGFSLGAAFITHYAKNSAAENRLVALSPNSSRDVALPTSRDKNYIKVLFTCGTSDGNMDGMLKALPVYQSFGYDARLYKEQGVTHMVGDLAHFEVVRYFKWVADSILKGTPSGAARYQVLPLTEPVELMDASIPYFMITGKLLPRNGIRPRASGMIINQHRVFMKPESAFP